jgi:hypothetical protein
MLKKNLFGDTEAYLIFDDTVLKYLKFFFIKIETKIKYNKIKLTRNYFELCLTV